MKFSSDNTRDDSTTSSDCVCIPRPEHCISRQNIDPDALKVMYRLKNCGYTAYLVGGAVRDLLLGRQPKDFDVSTDARPRQIKKLFHNCFLIGRRFRLAHIRFPDNIIETSTFRRQPEHGDKGDDPDAELYQRRDNCYGSPHEDVLRRDFTINALFYELNTFSVIDYVGGLEDLKAGVIRCIGDPNIRFREDPVRMIRAIRFASRMGFKIAPDTFNAIRVHHDEIEKASPARLVEEIYKLFAFQSGRESFRLLYKTLLLGDLFPELVDYIRATGEEESPLWKWLDGLDRDLKVLDGPTPALIFSVLYAGPIMTRYQDLSEQGGNVVYADIVRDFLSPLLGERQIPKLVGVRVEQILLGQLRFDPSKKRRFSKRGFVAQESFPETLAFYEISTAVLNNNRDRLASWTRLYREEVIEKLPPEPELLAEPLEATEHEAQDFDRPLAPWERFTRPSRRKSADTKRSAAGKTSGRRRKSSTKEKVTAAEPEERSSPKAGKNGAVTSSENPGAASGRKRSRKRKRRRRPSKGGSSAENAS